MRACLGSLGAHRLLFVAHACPSLNVPIGAMPTETCLAMRSDGHASSDDLFDSLELQCHDHSHEFIEKFSPAQNHGSMLAIGQLVLPIAYDASAHAEPVIGRCNLVQD